MPKLDDSTKTRVVTAARLVVLAALGVLAGLVLYWPSAVILLLCGFSFAAVSGGFFLAFAIWLVGAPIAYVRLRGRSAEFRRGLLALLAGMLAWHLYTCLGVLVENPQSIPWPR